MKAPTAAGSILSLLALVPLGLSPAAASDEPWLVSSVTLGQGLEPEHQECPALFVTALTREGLPARLDGALSAHRWNRTPPGATGDRRLIFAVVRTGTRIELLAFRPRGQAGTIDLIARQPAAADAHRQVPSSLLPACGPAQALRHAIAYLAARVARALTHTEAGALDGKAVCIRTERMNEATTDWNGGLEALAFAAASQAGLRPTAAGKPSRLVVRASKHAVLCKLQVEWHDGDRIRSFDCERVLEQGLFEVLAAAVKNVVQWDGLVADLKYISPPPESLIGFSKGKLIFAGDGRIGSLDLGEGTLSWLTPREAPGNPAYASRLGLEGEPMVYKYSPRLELISTKDGTVTRLLNHPSSHPWGFALPADGGPIAVAEGDQISLYRKGKPVWTHQTATSINGGPLATGDRLVLGEENCDLRCLSLTEKGRVLWCTPTGQRLHGPLKRVGGPRGLLLASSLEGTLFAVSIDSGRMAWRVDLEDRVVGQPVRVGNSVAVASGSGGIWLIDRERGSVLQRRKHPVALKHFVAVQEGTGRHLASSDFAGTFSFLSGEDLSTVREAKMPLMSCLLASTYRPVNFPGEDDLVTEPEPVVIAADRSGVIYFMPDPESAPSDQEDR